MYKYLGDNLDKLKHLVYDILQNNHIRLYNSCSICLQPLARVMYSNGLIGEATNKSPQFDGIIAEFTAGMEWITSIDKLKEHLSLLLISFNSQGGILSKAGTILQTEFSKRGVQISINQTMIASND